MDSLIHILYDPITRDNEKSESKEMRGKGNVKKRRKQKGNEEWGNNKIGRAHV